MSHKVVAVSTSKIWPFYTYRNRNNVENWDSTFFFSNTERRVWVKCYISNCQPVQIFSTNFGAISSIKKKKVRKHSAFQLLMSIKGNAGSKLMLFIIPIIPTHIPKSPILPCWLFVMRAQAAE